MITRLFSHSRAPLRLPTQPSPQASDQSASSSGSGTTNVTVNLTGVTNAQRITLMLSNVSDGTSTRDVGVQIGMLIGDANGDGIVNSADRFLTRIYSGIPTDETNYRSDANADGWGNSGDTFLVRSHSGESLP